MVRGIGDRGAKARTERKMRRKKGTKNKDKGRAKGIRDRGNNERKTVDQGRNER
jgi:hypothetical protein